MAHYFDDPKQQNFAADFGFTGPHETKSKCKFPVFANPYLHRIAIMKDYHVGSKGDADEAGLPGWVTKFICTGCGKRYKMKITGGAKLSIRSYFVPDTKADNHTGPIMQWWNSMNLENRFYKTIDWLKSQGRNTAERHPDKLTDDEIRQIYELYNPKLM